jgi:hypothetical protein
MMMSAWGRVGCTVQAWKITGRMCTQQQQQQQQQQELGVRFKVTAGCQVGAQVTQMMLDRRGSVLPPAPYLSKTA